MHRLHVGQFNYVKLAGLDCFKGYEFLARNLGLRKTIFTRESRMLRASLPSSGRLSVCPSVCPSVCHTRGLYQNGAS